MFFIISDNFYVTHSIGLLKGEILAQNNEANVIDYYHQIKLNNISEAAFIARSIKTSNNQPYTLIIKVGKTKQLIVYKHNLNFYILPDNGLLTLIFENPDYNNVHYVDENNIQLALQCVNKNDLSELPKTKNFVFISRKKLTINPDFIRSQVIHINHHGNCYFDLTKETIDNFIGNQAFEVKVQHYTGLICTKIANNISEIAEGMPGVLFSKAGYLKLIINMGDARKLLRIKEDTNLIIEKYDK